MLRISGSQKDENKNRSTTKLRDSWWNLRQFGNKQKKLEKNISKNEDKIEILELRHETLLEFQNEG